MDQIAIDRKLPQSLEAEKCVLGALLLDPSVAPTLLQQLKAEDFYSTRHQVIFKVIQTTFDQFSTVDAVMVRDELDKQGVAAELGGMDYLEDVMVSVSTVANAEYHAKINQEDFARDLHYLGRLYNTAVIGVETGGGYGDAVIIALRDQTKGRPAYPRIYRHKQESRFDKLRHKTFGFPMSPKTRPLVVGGLEQAIRERALPFVSNEALLEYNTFAHQETYPSPRAQMGCNDDRVMAHGIAIELYRQLGHHDPREKRRDRLRKRAKRSQDTAPSRMAAAPGTSGSRMNPARQRRRRHGSEAEEAHEGRG